MKNVLQFYSKVAVYQIRKEGWKKVSTFKTSSSGKINVEMPNKKTNLEMRVKYQGFDGWSQWQWVASDSLVRLILIFRSDSNSPTDMSEV